MVSKTVYEILQEVSSKRSKQDRVAVLHKYSSPQLKEILGYAFNKHVRWLLPEGNPPFTPLKQSQDQESGLMNQIKKLYLFVDGPLDTQKNLKQSRREQLFIQVLESIDPRDCEVLLCMKDKRLPFKNITKEIVQMAFPNLTKDW